MIFTTVYLLGYWIVSVLLIRMSVELRENGFNYPRMIPILIMSALWPYALYLALKENATY